MHQKLDITDSSFSKMRPYQPSGELLLGAGPTNCSARVMYTVSNSPILIPSLRVYEVMKELKEMLKFVFQTKNDVTLAIQTSGTGGLEAALANVVEPGEKILVAVTGLWGERTIEIANIRKIDAVRIDPKSSAVFDIKELEEEIIKHRPVLLFITHGESSTGIAQPLEGLGEICHKYNCLLAVDAVVSLGAIPLFVDRWNVDIAVSAPQKAARSLPGLAYLTFSPKAVKRMQSLKNQPPFYLNVLSLCPVWKCFDNYTDYYYTYNSNMLSAAREGLAEIIEEGLIETWEKHEQVNKELWNGLEKLGLKVLIENPEHRLYPVTCVYLPLGVTWEALNTYMVEKYQIYLGIGIGPSALKCFRVGIMGYNARTTVVDYFLEKLGEAMKHLQAQNN